MRVAKEPPAPLVILGVCGLAMATHATAVPNGFVFDDVSAVVSNPVVTGEAPWSAAFMTDFWGRAAEQPGRVGTWRPLPVLLSRLLFSAGRGAAWPLHLLGVLLHGAAAVALALAGWRHTRRWRLGVVSATLFATFAVNSEAVASIVGSADLLATGLVLAAWALLGAPDATPPVGRLAVAGLLMLGAGLSKESALAAPVLLVAIDGLAGSNARRLLLVGLALGAGACCAVALRLLSFGGFALVTVTAIDNPLVGEALLTRVLTAFALFGRAAGLVVAPLDLSPDYSFDAISPAQSLFDADVLLGVALLTALVSLAVALGRRVPGIAAGTVVFVGGFFLVSNVPVVLPALFAERLLYFPAVGAALALGAALEAWWVHRPRLALAVLAVFSTCQAGRGAARGLDWRDDLSLFSRAVETQPRSARAWTNLGVALAGAQRREEALDAYRQALTIAPTLAAAHTRAGVLLDELGRPAEAEEHLRAAARADPVEQVSVRNYVVFLVRRGRREEAATLARSLVERRPTAENRRLLEAIERLGPPPAP